MTGTKYRFYSKADGNNQPKVRVSVVALHDPKNANLKVAVARCSQRDRFARKVGRSMAEQRLAENQLHATVENVKESWTYKEFMKFAENVCDRITKHPEEIRAGIKYTQEPVNYRRCD